jgi:hypothetical protein
MDPGDVDSAADVREGWDGWSYSERVGALESLANATLKQYGYDSVTVDTGDAGDYTGEYDDGEIILDPSLIENPDPQDAIHETDHETIHAMNDQDGVDDWSYQEGDDFDFSESDLDSLERHAEIGDVARQLDEDGFGPWADPNGGGGGGGGAPAAGGGESDAGTDAPKQDDVELEIDWAQGVWIDTPTDSGMSVDTLYAAPEGW